MCIWVEPGGAGQAAQCLQADGLQLGEREYSALHRNAGPTGKDPGRELRLSAGAGPGAAPGH